MRLHLTKPTALALLLAVSLLSVASPVSAVSGGQICKKAGLTATSTSGGKTVLLTCVKVGKKLLWVKIPAVVTSTTIASTTTIAANRPTVISTTTVALKETTSQSNARRSAQSYLSFMSFSRTGLIKQLEYEGFSTSDATYGVDALNANWTVQAKKSAQSYLSNMSFSRAGLIKQLEFEGFSSSDATYGVDVLNANWNEQAKKSAQSYLDFSSFSRSGLINQLIFEGFTQGQAEYGVSAVGF